MISDGWIEIGPSSSQRWAPNAVRPIASTAISSTKPAA